MGYLNCKHDSLLSWFVLIPVFVSIISCNKNEPQDLPGKVACNNAEVRIIPIETSLDYLNDFLYDSQMINTKSGAKRIVSSVETHYNSRESVPDAYLVNFEDNSGYAILGANTSVDPVIAVIENGNSSWKRILSPEENDSDSFESESIDPGIKPEKLVSLCVRGALYGMDLENENVETKDGGYSVEILPLTSYLEFGQYVTYCHKSNRRFVLSGCAATAISIIVAHNNYPRITADYELLDLSYCNSSDGLGLYFCIANKRELFFQLKDYFINYPFIPTPTTDAERLAILKTIDSNITTHGSLTASSSSSYFTRTRYKLIASIYYLLNNIITGWSSTGTMPAAVKNGLQDLGYLSVTQVQKSSLTNSQINSIIDMLNAGKPVILCGWSLFGLSNSHYWVVDGIRINSSHTYIHCNWGWNGVSNGWFSSTCIRSSAGVPFDDGTTGTGSGDEWDNIIVYTYNMSSSVPSVSIHELYDNRITYWP